MRTFRGSERVEDELSAHVVGHRPTDDATREQVDDDGQVQPALLRPDVRDVRDPRAIRFVDSELPVEHVLGHRQLVVRIGGLAKSR